MDGLSSGQLYRSNGLNGRQAGTLLKESLQDNALGPGTVLHTWRQHYCKAVRQEISREEFVRWKEGQVPGAGMLSSHQNLFLLSPWNGASWDWGVGVCEGEWEYEGLGVEWLGECGAPLASCWIHFSFNRRCGKSLTFEIILLLFSHLISKLVS